MKIQYQDKTYYVTFLHFTDPDRTLKGTTCRIYDNPEKKNGKVLAIGATILAHGDHYKKSVGRKLSFGRALNSLFKEDKSARTFFWRQYHSEMN